LFQLHHYCQRNVGNRQTKGDLWYFPPGTPHSLQAKNDTRESKEGSGAEFLLIFDSGSFSEYSTFQLTDWMAHAPKDVLAKNFQIFDDQRLRKELDKIPDQELYIFPPSTC